MAGHYDHPHLRQTLQALWSEVLPLAHPSWDWFGGILMLKGRDEAKYTAVFSPDDGPQLLYDVIEQALATETIWTALDSYVRRVHQQFCPDSTLLCQFCGFLQGVCLQNHGATVKNGGGYAATESVVTCERML
jgi:hypothetical protein